MKIMRLPSLILLFGLIACIGCWPFITHDEVNRVSSPDNRFDAILLEVNGGATTSFVYEVMIGKKGSRRGAEVARLYGATRNAQAYGVNLRWEGNGRLVIQYLNAKSLPVAHESVDVNGRHIQVLLRSGISDPNAPPGGMLYNLKRK